MSEAQNLLHVLSSFAPVRARIDVTPEVRSWARWVAERRQALIDLGLDATEASTVALLDYVFHHARDEEDEV